MVCHQRVVRTIAKGDVAALLVDRRFVSGLVQELQQRRQASTAARSRAGGAMRFEADGRSSLAGDLMATVTGPFLGVA